MGAWGAGNFDNDDAMDWVDMLVSGDDPSLVEETLRTVADAAGDQYVEALEAASALAAAEVVAASNGYAPSDGFPEEAEGLDEWVEAHRSRVAADLVDLALRSVDRIAKDSELREL